MPLTEAEEKELLMLLEAEEADQAKENYINYVEHVHEGRWLRGKHLVYICDKVQALIEHRLFNEDGERIQILIIQVPPQHGKSQSVTETLPSFYLGKYPKKRVIEVSYGDDLAQKFGRRNKEKIEKYGKKLFNIQISKKTASATEFELSNNIGSMISRGIMSGITGQPGDLIIIDDPVKNKQEAYSESYRDRMWDEWLFSIKTRLSAEGVVILIQTRWHEDDLAGRMIKAEGKKVMAINLPCEAEENDILGREKGDPLFPEIGKDKKWLEDFKKTYLESDGSQAWNALFQGRPSAQEGNMLKRDWWKRYSSLPRIMYKVISVDAAVKEKETSDYTSIQVWGKSGVGMYLIDRFKKQMNFPDTLKAIEQMKGKHPDVNAIYIEDKANGSPIIQVLREKMGCIIPINPIGDKVYRVNSIIGSIESGNCYVPDMAEFTDDFIDECASFPNGAHDDDVDAMSQAILKLRTIPAAIPSDDKGFRDDFGIYSNHDEDEFEPTLSYINMGR